MKIGSNIPALQAQRRLAESGKALSLSYERLSSGLRITRSSDDAAALAVAATLNSQSKIYGQAIKNLNDGLSVLSTAEAALTTLRDISLRQLELAEQAANGGYSLLQRRALNDEANALVKEYNRIIASTRFNERGLLEGSTEFLLQAGAGEGALERFVIGEEISRTVGTGSFVKGITSSVSVPPVCADLNGDGAADIAAVQSGQLVVMLSNRDGSFASQAPVTVAPPSGSLLAGDVDNDGLNDVILSSGSSFSILLGNGDGTFEAPLTVTTSGSTALCRSGDIDGDGKIDLLYMNGGLATVLLGRGDGTFSAEKSTTVAVGAVNPIVADLNGDGRDDIATVSSTGIASYLSMGDGTFSLHGITSFAGATTSYTGASGDVNGDGTDDIALAFLTGPVLLLGDGRGGFSASLSIAQLGYSTGASIADFNGDGRNDLAIVSRGTPMMGMFVPHYLTVSLGNGDGTFTRSFTGTPYANVGPSLAAAADFRGDGVNSVAMSSQGTFAVYVNQATATNSAAYLNLCTRAGAMEAMESVRASLERIEQELGSMGSAMSRVSAALGAMYSVRENSRAAASRIMDADIADCSSQMLRQQIIHHAAASILAQANQQPAVALSLLAGP